MTREKWATMSADERRIKVAELCGWKSNGAGYFHKARTFSIGGGETRTILDVASLYPECHDDCGGIGSGETEVLPDYLNDLNAMHEAERPLRGDDHDLRGEYLAYLLQVMDASCARWLGAFATAAQRAEAFVLTIEPENVNLLTKEIRDDT